MPRVHPVVQVIGVEWGGAKAEKRTPDWDVITYDYIAQLCDQMSEDHPNWHASFTSLNLSSYLDGIEPSKMWWLLEEEEEEEEEDADTPSGPCSKKRAAPDSPDDPIESDDTTPRKSSRPQVEVVITSPPRHSQCICKSNSGTVATGNDRCGPCKDCEDEECWSQPTGKRQTTTCIGCAKVHKTCNPPAAWAFPGTRSADARSVSSAWTRTPSAVVDAQIEALTREVQEMHLKISKLKTLLANEIEENQREREESRWGCEEGRRGCEDFQTAHQNMHNTVLMGIVSASIPSIGQRPVSRSRTRSPANLPSASPGIPLSTLKISNAQSTVSSCTSSALSERRRATGICFHLLHTPELPGGSVAGSPASRRSSPSAPLPEPSAGHSGGSASSHKSSPGQQGPQ
ncbi:hypothetical protein EDB83DRAFT_2321822 [Lactarius deliciosus]|nr:hypothetical protein EDB83DRAFT_2321822 [Lactarius deliciosus]